MFTTIDEHGRKQTYDHVRHFKPGTMHNGEKLVIVLQDGEPNLWLVEDELGLEELKRMYRMEYNCDPKPVVLVDALIMRG